MDFKTLEQLITETASQKAIDTTVIIDDLADILKIKYGISIMEKERDLIDEVKTKITTKLYNSENHACGSNLDLSKTFKLDALESDYLNSALDELQHEGVVLSGKSEIKLTKEGIMKFKEFYGEI
jgi:hypothetical protein